jgi:hypothetical protein
VAPGGEGVVAQRVKESKDANFGYNALTREYGDVMKMGIHRPDQGRAAKAVRFSSIRVRRAGTIDAAPDWPGWWQPPI